jgi:hypothetical protein
MPREDLTTYEVWFNDDGVSGQPLLLATFQDEVGLDSASIYTAAVAHLQGMIDKINTPSPDTLFTRVGVVHPPGVSVRRQRWQDES